MLKPLWKKMVLLREWANPQRYSGTESHRTTGCKRTGTLNEEMWVARSRREKKKADGGTY